LPSDEDNQLTIGQYRKEQGAEERIEKRKDVIELRRQAKIELHKKKNDNYENMEK
jgi:hypothetical protein